MPCCSLFCMNKKENKHKNHQKISPTAQNSHRLFTPLADPIEFFFSQNSRSFKCCRCRLFLFKCFCLSLCMQFNCFHGFIKQKFGSQCTVRRFIVQTHWLASEKCSMNLLAVCFSSSSFDFNCSCDARASFASYRVWLLPFFYRPNGAVLQLYVMQF